MLALLSLSVLLQPACAGTSPASRDTGPFPGHRLVSPGLPGMRLPLCSSVSTIVLALRAWRSCCCWAHRISGCVSEPLTCCASRWPWAARRSSSPVGRFSFSSFASSVVSTSAGRPFSTSAPLGHEESIQGASEESARSRHLCHLALRLLECRVGFSVVLVGPRHVLQGFVKFVIACQL